MRNEINRSSSNIIGRQPVLEALRDGAQLERIFLQKNVGGEGIDEIKQLAQKHNIPINTVPIEKLHSMTRANHQGVIGVNSIISFHDLQESIDNVLAEYFDESVRFRFTARTDIITAKTVWELKCVREITIDHKLQVVIYAWIYRILNPNSERAFRMFNINTNEVLELKASFEQLNFIVVSLLQGKYQESVAKTDDEFIMMCKQ